MRIIFFLPLLLLSFSVLSQKKNEAYKLQLHRTAAPLVIDGILDEPDWQKADVATDFYMVVPMDTSSARVKTEVRMAYDNDHLYLIAVCYHLVPARRRQRERQGES